MTTYAVIRFEVTNADAYGRYSELAGPSVKLHGGEFIFKGKRVEQAEGNDHLDRHAVIAFPSTSTARQWFDSADYQAAVAARQGAGEMSIEFVEAA